MSTKVKSLKHLRADAAQALFLVLEQGQSASDVLPFLQEQHKDQDKAWLQEMVYGVLRQLPLLQHWLRQMLDKPLKNRFKITEHLLILGFYQLAFSRVSEHAAVSETVDACKALNIEAMRGLVNGVLRNFIRNETKHQLPDNPQVLSGLPKWLYKRLEQQYPESITQIAENLQARPPLWLRINQRIKTRAEYAKALEQAGISFQLSPEHPDGLIIEDKCDIKQLPGFDDGWFAVQDGAAQLAAYLLSPKAGERVLDCCAAPGGKTCHILELQPDLAKCIALDASANRLTRVHENLQRLGLEADVICADAADPASWWDQHQFDRILLDAPCSATGVIRKHPDIKWLRKSADIEQLASLQKEMLDAIWPLLAPGGTLLYATCSVLSQENSEQVANFLQRTPDARLSPISENESAELPGRQILPGEQQMDGFYYARLVKSDE